MIKNHPNGEASKGSPALARSEASTSTGVVEALRQLRTRSPEEMLGVNAAHGLMRSFLQATAGTVILFLALTIIPFYVDKADRQNAAENPPKQPAGETKDAAATPSPPTATSEPETVAKKNPKTSTEPGKTAKEKTVINLRESDVKTGKPNPLTTKDDDLFKD